MTISSGFLLLIMLFAYSHSSMCNLMRVFKLNRMLTARVPHLACLCVCFSVSERRLVFLDRMVRVQRSVRAGLAATNTQLYQSCASEWRSLLWGPTLPESNLHHTVPRWRTHSSVLFMISSGKIVKNWNIEKFPKWPILQEVPGWILKLLKHKMVYFSFHKSKLLTSLHVLTQKQFHPTRTD